MFLGELSVAVMVKALPLVNAVFRWIVAEVTKGLPMT